MPTKPRGVLARVLMTVLSLALVVGVILAAQPAGAAGRRPDALADAASAALAALGQRRQAYAAVAESVLERGDRAVVGAEAVFAQARLAVALHAAPRAGLDPAALDAVWSATADQRMVAVFAALSQVGVPYRRNSSNPGSLLRLLGPHHLCVGRGRCVASPQLGQPDQLACPTSRWRPWSPATWSSTPVT